MVVVRLGIDGKVLVQLGSEREGKALLLVSRVGQNPVVAPVGDGEAGARPLAVAAVDAHRVVECQAGLKESGVPVVLVDPRGRREGAGVPVLGVILIAQLVCIELLTESVARDVTVDGNSVSSHVSRECPKAEGLQTEVRTGTVLLLELGEIACLLPHDGGAEGHPDAFVRTSLLRGDDDGAVGSARTVEGGCRRTLQDAHRLDVLGIDVAGTVTEVHGGISLCIVAHRLRLRRARIDGDAVHHEEGFVRPVVERLVATQGHAQRASRSGSGTSHGQACHLAVEGIEPVVRQVAGHLVLTEFGHGVAQ